MRKRSDPNRASWSAQLAVLKSEILKMMPGAERDAAQQRADSLAAAIAVEGWLRSPGLKPPI